MSVTSVYPVLQSTSVATTAAFYQKAFGFEPVFESDWYVSMKLGDHELAVLDANHETIPDGYRGVVSAGLLLNIEVVDVDSEYDRLFGTGEYQIVLPLRSEAFGQRHFIVSAPDGVLVDVITPIEPEESFVAQFMTTSQA